MLDTDAARLMFGRHARKHACKSAQRGGLDLVLAAFGNFVLSRPLSGMRGVASGGEATASAAEVPRQLALSTLSVPLCD